ncbi:programmed cell death 1 ligand 1-like isoform X4 [Myripristis murdjan]|uniref:programmed cell death 1 ligand 1-like isoform X4 n=1 Tax=Myripristis murdjan TaxID=586833 RepID=UPI001175E9A3|nr:programmed cell death 1 ligand 1-like isoform X4 [Myripristis murdjan]
MLELVKTFLQVCRSSSGTADVMVLQRPREEMISILLLVVLTASDCGALVLNVRQSVSQAEENRNVTMEWTFTPNMRLKDMELHFALWVSDVKTLKTVYLLLEGVELSGFQDEQFAGRVGLDKDELRKGNIRLHLSRLRTEDSGVYRCKVSTYHDGTISECSLNVTAARIQPTAEETQPTGRGRIALFV